MKKYLPALFISLFLLVSAVLIKLPDQAQAASLDHVNGRILLQVAENGEAWYIHPDDGKRYYMKNGPVAFMMMRSFGEGISNSDIAKIPVGLEDRFTQDDTDGDGLADNLEVALGTDINSIDTDEDGFTDGEEVRSGHNPLGDGLSSVDQGLVDRFRGRILLQVEEHGEAWYINPDDGKRYYMSSGEAAYDIMRFLSLGATTTDIESIPFASFDPEVDESLVTFGSDSEFDGYVEFLTASQEEKSASDGYTEDYFFGGPDDFASETGLSAPSESEAKESITNVQEVGVDEGDIVKAWGDYLVILRRGRLFTVDTDESRPNPVHVLNVFPEGMTPGTWYDEMLISDDTVIVIGYRYDWRKAEIGLFTINRQGTLSHNATYFVDADDYYSSRNYASRLLDDKLIMYMPSNLFSYSYYSDFERQPRIPHISKWTGGDQTVDLGPILDKKNIFRPIQKDHNPTLHTVMTCQVSSGDLDCSSKAVLGPWSRTFYVSPNAAYVWVSERSHPIVYEVDEFGQPTDEIKFTREPQAHLYRFGFEPESVGVIRADGQPIDQFSFQEIDGYLNVVVDDDGYGDAMWLPEFASGELGLFRIQLSAFSGSPHLVSPASWSSLPRPESYRLQNRFVGDHLLYGSSAYWESNGSTLFVKNVPKNGPVNQITLASDVTRIEPMGRYSAAVIGSDDDNLVINTVDISTADPFVADNYVIPQATEGESRSHGFFFKPNEDGGTIGLPIRKYGPFYSSLWEESAEIRFFDVDGSLGLRSIGSFEATQPRHDSNCQVSCVDWYGNSRPIFYHGNIFGLMGYELVKGTLGDTVTETGRVDVRVSLFEIFDY